jgi:hypothetical protein
MLTTSYFVAVVMLQVATSSPTYADQPAPVTASTLHNLSRAPHTWSDIVHSGRFKIYLNHASDLIDERCESIHCNGRIL